MSWWLVRWHLTDNYMFVKPKKYEIKCFNQGHGGGINLWLCVVLPIYCIIQNRHHHMLVSYFSKKDFWRHKPLYRYKMTHNMTHVFSGMQQGILPYGA